MMNQGTLSIIIVNWNTKHQLRECIASIVTAKSKSFVLSEVVIVDNASTDDSLLGVDQLGIKVTIIKNSENRGFAKACNQGAAVALGNYSLFLNPDARVMDGSLDKLMEFMATDAAKHIGICGVRLLDECGFTQRHCARFPTLLTYLGQATGLNFFSQQLFPNHFMHEFDHLSSREVDQVIGAFFLVRHNVFNDLNGFDERFFVYFEELDFSLRAYQTGWRTFYLADAIGFHKGGGSSEQVKAHRLFYSLHSRLLYGFKHFPRYKAYLLILVTLLIEPCSRMILALFRRSWDDAKYTLQAYGMLIFCMHNILRVGLSKDI
jgi:N-acetylglucosaminyl-diphospho-decaprenol L-rhamnosyltransferase